MEPGGDPIQFHDVNIQVSSKPSPIGGQIRNRNDKCVISMTGLSVKDEMECQILENNSARLNRAEIERVVWKHCNILLRQQQDSKTPSASKDTSTADRGNGKN